ATSTVGRVTTLSFFPKAGSLRVWKGRWFRWDSRPTAGDVAIDASKRSSFPDRCGRAELGFFGDTRHSQTNEWPSGGAACAEISSFECRSASPPPAPCPISLLLKAACPASVF